MSSSGNDSSYEEKVKVLNSEPGPSTSADPEPSASASVPAEFSKDMKPEFRKTKMVVTIEEDGTELKPSVSTKKLGTGKKLKSTKQLQSLALNPGSAGLSKGVNKTTPHHIRRIGGYTLSTTFEPLDDDKPETPAERSYRLLFEAKRKEHYKAEGLSHIQSHVEHWGSDLELDYEFKSPEQSEDKSPPKKTKKSKATRNARLEKSKIPRPLEKSNPPRKKD